MSRSKKTKQKGSTSEPCKRTNIVCKLTEKQSTHLNLLLVSKPWERKKMIPEEAEEVPEEEEDVLQETESQRREAEDKPLEKL